MDRFTWELSADTLAPEDERPDGLFSFGTPTDAQMAELRRRGIILDEGILAEELVTWTIQAINNITHAKNMWMDETSLRNFLARASSGRGIPYLRDHNSRNGTTGRVYAGELVNDGPAPAATAVEGMVPTFRDLFRDPSDVLRLYEQVYMLRDGTEEERAHVAKIRAGVQASNSVGFGVYGPLEPGSSIECDACKVDLFRVDYETCPHYPGLEYEVNVAGPDAEAAELVTALATARVINAQQDEVSGVYLGAVPDTFTERGRALFRAGLMSTSQARRAEEIYRLTRGRIVGDERSTSLPTRAPAGGHTGVPAGGAQTKRSEHVKAEDLLARVRELAGSPERVADLELHGLDEDPIRALVSLHEAETAELKRAAEDAKAAHEALKAKLVERLEAREGETLDQALDRWAEGMKIAGQVRARLEEEYFRQMTRAGMPPDQEEQRALMAGWSLDQIERQTKRLKDLADSSLKPGRISEPRLDDRHGDGENPKTPAHRRVARV